MIDFLKLMANVNKNGRLQNIILKIYIFKISILKPIFKQVWMLLNIPLVFILFLNM